MQEGGRREGMQEGGGKKGMQEGGGREAGGGGSNQEQLHGVIVGAVLKAKFPQRQKPINILNKVDEDE